MRRHPPEPTLFPSPPLFRSRGADGQGVVAVNGGTVSAGVPAGASLGVRLVPDGSVVPRLAGLVPRALVTPARQGDQCGQGGDRKSTRLNSSQANISYAVFCL